MIYAVVINIQKKKKPYGTDLKKKYLYRTNNMGQKFKSEGNF